MRRVYRGLVVCAVLGALIVPLIPTPVLGMTGSGTALDPYIIWDVGDLQDMQNDLSAYYELGTDIDASATTGWNGGSGFKPVGTFTGSLDGKFYEITDLYMNWVNNSSHQRGGLFSQLGSGASVSNLIIWDADITVYKCEIAGTYYAYAGVLCGEIYQGSGVTISQVYVHGECSAYLCSNSGQYVHAGGLVGRIFGGSVTINSTAAYVDVHADSVDGGGTFDEAIATAGGFIGGMWQGSGATASVTNCYARGDVSADATGADGGAAHAAGFVETYHTNPETWTVLIDNCYATGLVSATGYYPATAGFVRVATGGCSNITDSFWDIETTAQATSTCATGKNTTAMKTKATFTDVGWDFVTVWDIGGVVNDGYPFLRWWAAPPPDIIQDIYQVVWFQPNHIIQGTELPNRAGYTDGVIHWGANPPGITITYSEFHPEEEYWWEEDFGPFAPEGPDIIKPEPTDPTSDVDLVALERNPLRPLVQVLSAMPGITERLAWLMLAWFTLIAAMLLVHIGPDTHRKDTKRPHHFVLTTLTGLGLAILFYAIGIFDLWAPILLGFGFITSIIYERMPVL